MNALRTLACALALALPLPALAQEGASPDAASVGAPQANPHAVGDGATGPHGGGEPMPAGHPAVDPSTMPRAPRDPFDAPPVATSQPALDLPRGSIRVLVVDVDGHPVPRATVVLGTMGQGGNRTRVSATTGDDGRHVWADLPSGQGQAYRVSVPFEGASYGAMPFQLPTDHGYDVRVVRLPVTHDDRVVLQVIGQTFVELRNERLHVVQQAQLGNMSQSAQTYVFPEEGLHVRLPTGHLAFQSEPVMSDQRLEAVEGEGFRIRGSLPPGRVSLTWAFDVPIHGVALDFTLAVPFRTYLYRVITEAPEGLRLELDGMPAPERFDDQGRSLLGSELMRRPGDPPFDHVVLRFSGIPGPGPARWVAAALAALALLGGLYAALFRGSPEALAAKSRAQRKDALLAEAAELDALLASGEIGPRHRQSRRAAIVRELAVLLHLEQAASAGASASVEGPKATARPAGAS